MAARMKGYKDMFEKVNDFVFYQGENGKVWYGPVKMFVVWGNSMLAHDQGDTK